MMILQKTGANIIIENNCKNRLYLPKNTLEMFFVNAYSLNNSSRSWLLNSVIHGIIAVSKSRIMKTFEITQNINLIGFNIKYTLAESHVRGTTLCVSNYLAWKPDYDLKFYKTNELDSAIIELINLVVSTCMHL